MYSSTYVFSSAGSDLLYFYKIYGSGLLGAMIGTIISIKIAGEKSLFWIIGVFNFIFSLLIAFVFVWIGSLMSGFPEMEYLLIPFILSILMFLSTWKLVQLSSISSSAATIAKNAALQGQAALSQTTHVVQSSYKASERIMTTSHKRLKIILSIGSLLILSGIKGIEQCLNIRPDNLVFCAATKSLFFIPLAIPFVLIWSVWIHNFFTYKPKWRWIIGAGIGTVIALSEGSGHYIANGFGAPIMLMALPFTGLRIENFSIFRLWHILAAIPLYGLLMGYIFSFLYRPIPKPLKIQMAIIIPITSFFVLGMGFLLANAFN